MKHVIRASLLAAVVAVLTAFTGTASATVATSPAGTLYTGTVKVETEGEFTFENTNIGLKVQCQASGEGKIESHGPTVTAVGFPLFDSVTGCTNGYTVTILKHGTGEAHLISGTANATLTSSGTEATVHTPLGFSCTYTTSNTDVGIGTGSKTTGGTATVDMNSVVIPRTADSALCGTQGVLKGSMKVTTPDYLDAS
ncbi:MAG: hypothetical protein ACTHN3_14915 [Solirubrobacterales bacterium]